MRTSTAAELELFDLDRSPAAAAAAAAARAERAFGSAPREDVHRLGGQNVALP
jgi:hypothetical protein